MKSLATILKENLAKKSNVTENGLRKRLGKGLAKAASSVGKFAKSVIVEPHVDHR